MPVDRRRIATRVVQVSDPLTALQACHLVRPGSVRWWDHRVAAIPRQLIVADFLSRSLSVLRSEVNRTRGRAADER